MAILLFYKRYPGGAPFDRHTSFGNLIAKMGNDPVIFKRAFAKITGFV